jgi:CheY-like chemotaxis protein
MVDDNGLGLVARKSVLEELGHRITIASTAEDALELFTNQRFELLITDFKLPNMNGVELTAQVRKVRSDIPVILISGFTDALGLNEATTGADLVIQKSSQEVSQLIRGVSRLLGRAPRKPASSAGRARQRDNRAARRAGPV